MTKTATQSFTTGNHPVIGKCRNGHTVRSISAESQKSGGWIRCACGANAFAKYMNVRIVAEKTCNGICMGATGPSCSCSCGGENHGSHHAYEV